jgi:choline kinase
MRAIILAAGTGKRLSQVHKGPKCLLHFNGRSLLERHLTHLKENGVTEITIVVGYEKEKVIAALPTGKNYTINVAVNPDYELGSIVSLKAATETLVSGENVILMDADVLYDSKIIEVLIKSQKPNCVLLDRAFIDGEEPVKVCLERDKIVHFGKTLPHDIKYDKVGESVGFFKFSASIANKLAENTTLHCANNPGIEPHEVILEKLFLSDRESFATEDITGLPWIEIDFPEDIVRAEKEILRRIE